MASLTTRIAQAWKAFRFSGMGGGGYGSGDAYGWNRRQLAGSNYDYRAEAGLLWENSIVLACINWKVRTMPEAPLCVQEKQDGKWIVLDDHPVLDLLNNPNPYYDASVMWGGNVLSWDVAGNAYCYKVRSGAGKVLQLIYIPHWQIRPMWPVDGSEFISYYEYRVNGALLRFKPSDVVHLRSGMDPANTRVGLSDLSAALREVCADNERATYEAALLRNNGVPGVVISSSDKDIVLSEDDAKKMERQWDAKFTGDGRGRPLFSSLPIKVEVPAFNSNDMMIEQVRLGSEERICALEGVPPPLIGLASAGAGRSTYTNKEQAELEGWRGLKSSLGSMASQLTKQLGPDFMIDGRKRRIAFDFDKVAVLQPNKAEVWQYVTAAVGGPWVTVDEARLEAGLEPMVDGSGGQLISQIQQANTMEQIQAKPAPQLMLDSGPKKDSDNDGG